MIGIVISELAADLERANGNRPARNVRPSILLALMVVQLVDIPYPPYAALGIYRSDVVVPQTVFNMPRPLRVGA